jgi:hypothetical protein
MKPPDRRLPLLTLALVAAALSACSSLTHPPIAPGERIVDDPNIRFLPRITFSPDGDEIALLGVAIAGDVRAYRASLTDATLRATPVGDLLGASEIRYRTATDLIAIGNPRVAPEVACGRSGVVLIADRDADAVVGCPYAEPSGVIGRAGNVDVDPDHFTLVTPDGALIVPTATGARRIDPVTFDETPLAPGFPVALDPAGERLLLAHVDLAAWEHQTWSLLTLADGTIEPLAIDPHRFERGWHVMGVRWLPEGLRFLIERDHPTPAWYLWDPLDGTERYLGPARSEPGPGTFPLGRVPRLSASGRLIAFRTYECLLETSDKFCLRPSWSLIVVDLETGSRTTLYRGRTSVESPAISPDDQRVVFAVGGVVYGKWIR